jgi:hypothetical protein
MELQPGYSDTPTRLPAAPRKAHKRSGAADAGCLRFFILPHAAIGVVLAFCAVFQLLWLAAGWDYAGEVTKAEWKFHRKGDYYILTYQFLKDGQTMTQEEGVDVDMFKRFGGLEKMSAQERRVTVRSLNLGVTSMAGLVGKGSSEGTVWVALAAAVVWNLVVWLGVWKMWVWPMIVERIYTHGLVTAGVVTQTREDRGRPGGLFIEYAFKEPVTGVTFHGEVETQRHVFERAANGEAVTVLYDPRRPRWNVAYEYGAWRVEGELKKEQAEGGGQTRLRDWG